MRQSINVREPLFYVFRRFVVYFNTVSTFRDWFRRIVMRLRGWRVSFRDSSDTTLINDGPVKVCPSFNYGVFLSCLMEQYDTLAKIVVSLKINFHEYFVLLY